MRLIVARWRILACLVIALLPAAAAGTALSPRAVALLGSASLVLIVLLLGSWIAVRASEHGIDDTRHRLNQFDLRFERERENLGGVAFAVADVRRKIDQERGNLSKVASAVGELRAQMAGEQRNLGSVAQAVAELRDLIASRSGAAEGDFRSVIGLLEADNARIEALDGQLAEAQRTIAAEQGNLGKIAHATFELRQEIAAQRDNLGLVAGGMDHLRRSTAGFELVAGRHAAFEDALMEIAERVDLIGTDGAAPARPHAPDDSARPAA